MESIDGTIFDDLSTPPDFNEWLDVVRTAPANKAPGPSGISYDILKHLGPVALDVLYQLTCSCFRLKAIPIGWKRAAIYPIPKPTPWHQDLNNTRPITLLETPRKIMVKILTSRLSKIFVQNTILQSSQFAGLPGGSTMSPINVVKQLIDDARTNNKEIWLYLQDLSKCYDRVDTRILRHAMSRLKIPINFIDLVLDLFTNRRNFVLTDVGKTKDYDVLVGIDQGEVISPLLWCIYYDPLLTRIQKSSHLGYSLSHSFAPDVRSPDIITKQVSVPALAFMDDTLFCSGAHDNMQAILCIASSFHSFTNILVNDKKARLLSSITKPLAKKKNQPSQPRPTQTTFVISPSHSITVKFTPYANSIRYLGAWISIKKNDSTIIAHAKRTINHAVYNMRNAQLTDLQLLYIYNKVLIPQLEYRTQMTVLTKSNCDNISSLFIQLFKAKLTLARSTPNAILLNRWIYNYRDLYGVQLQAKLSNFLIALNHQSLLGIVTNIRLLQIQSQYSLDCNPIISWPLDSLANRPKVTFLESLLTLCKLHGFSYSVPESLKNTIQGGHTPLRSILNQQTFTSLKSFLTKNHIIFKSQLSEIITNRPLSWSSFCHSNSILLTITPIAWFKLLLAVFPGQPIFGESSPFCADPAPLRPESLLAFDSTSIPMVHSSCVPLDLISYHQQFLTTPFTKNNIWAVTWSPVRASPIIVRITFGTDESSLSYNIEHWIVTPSTSELRDLVTNSTNYDFLIPCSSPGCLLPPAPSHDTLAVTSNYCTSIGTTPLIAINIASIRSIRYQPGIFYSKVKSQTIFNSFMAYLINSSPNNPALSSSIITDRPLDFEKSNPNLFNTINSISYTLRGHASLSFHTDGSLVNFASPNARMGAAFILTEPSNLNIQLAISTTSWPSAYKAELLAVFLSLLVAPNNCTVNLFSDCDSVIKHFEYINNGSFNNIRNIFKQPQHNLWLMVLQEIQNKNLTILWHKVNSHSGDVNNDAVDRLARFSAYNQVSTVNSDIDYNPLLYLPCWNSRLINVHYRHFIRSLTYLQGLNSWNTLGRFSDYPTDAINWELTGSLLQPTAPGTSFLASRHKRNLLALMLEELPTLSKLQVHKPHVYDKDWTCCRCNLDEPENFNHLWLCSESDIALQNIIMQAKILLQDTIHLFTTDAPNMNRIFAHTTLWDLPQNNQTNVHTFFSFIDLIKGIIPSALANAIKLQGLSTSQVTLTLRTLLEYIQTTSWDLIWTPRCELFRKFLQDNNVTPEFQRSALPTGFLASSSSPTRNRHRSTSETILSTSKSLVSDYMNYGIAYPFPSGNNFVTWVLSIFW